MAIGIIFQSLDESFLSAGSLSNISVYIAGQGIMAVGIVFVLLLGEIDLSVGSVAGVGAAIWAVLSVTNGMGDLQSVLIAVAAGALIGGLHGFFFAKVGVPAFVVTLAGFLGWSGLQIWLMGSEGSINTPSGSIVENLTNYYFSDVAAAYGLAGAAVALYFLAMVLDSRRRRAAGLLHRPFGEVLFRAGLLAAVAFAAAYQLNQSAACRWRWCSSSPCWCSPTSSSGGRPMAGRSSRSAATPRRRAARVSTWRRSGSRSS